MDRQKSVQLTHQDRKNSVWKRVAVDEDVRHQKRLDLVRTDLFQANAEVDPIPCSIDSFLPTKPSSHVDVSVVARSIPAIICQPKMRDLNCDQRQRSSKVK